MNFPVWELEMGGGVLIAVVSAIHVFVAHFAVGGGLWLVLTEGLAHRRGDAELRGYVKRHSKVFILITLVLGAVTGVAIWFTTALVSPATLMVLTRAYLWGWAMEWVFFLVEIAAALVYWYGWEKLDPRRHRLVGWIYFGAAWMSLVVINGIVTFMLTPGRWLETGEFWHGFFNPTYWPSLAVRTAISLALAGVFTLLTTALLPHGPLRSRLSRYNAAWVLVGVVLAAAAAYWYRGAFPGWDDALLGAIPVLPVVVALMRWALVAVCVLALWPLASPRGWRATPAVLLMAAALVAFGAGEWVREAGRKPYTIHGHLYSTGLHVGDEEARVAADGVVAHTKWIDPAVRDGHDPAALGGHLYRAWCQPCHTRDGYNGLDPFLAHKDGGELRDLLPLLDAMRALMPAWHGDDGETAALAAHLAAGDGVADFPDDPDAAGRLAWGLSCGLCHTVDGYRPLRETLAGMGRDELADLLDTLTDYSERMPPYAADAAEREHLLDRLEALAAAEPASVAAAAGSPVVAERRAP